MKDLPREAEVVSSFFLEIEKVFVKAMVGSQAIVGVPILTTQTDPPQQSTRRGQEVRRHQEVDRRPHILGDQAGVVAVV